MVWLSGLLPYEQAAEVLERIGHRQVPVASIWRQTQEYGERLKLRVEHQREVSSIEHTVLPPAGLDHRQPKGISMDGGKVHLREEGWKEVKVGVVFDVEQRLERDPITREEVEQAHGVNMAYSAVIGSVDEFAPALWALAVEHDVPQSANSTVVADGADWIWNLVPQYFPDSVQVVDWFHACEHLGKAAADVTAVAADATSACERWFKQWRNDLFKGNLHKITSWLDREGLEDHSLYFHKHKRRMQYQEFREEGHPIGSGTVESSIKQFKTRLTGPGMRWSRPGAERMLTIRTAILDRNFDAVWQAVV